MKATFFSVVVLLNGTIPVDVEYQFLPDLLPQQCERMRLTFKTTLDDARGPHWKLKAESRCLEIPDGNAMGMGADALHLRDDDSGTQKYTN